MSVEPPDPEQSGAAKVPKKAEWSGNENADVQSEKPTTTETVLAPSNPRKVEQQHASGSNGQFLRGCFYVLMALFVGFFLLLGTCLMSVR